MRSSLSLVILLAVATSASAQPVTFVDADATGGATGASWADAFPTLEPALAAATAGSEVWVAEGTYRPTATTSRSATFTLRPGVAVYGGFDGTETQRHVRDWAQNPTRLSGEIGAPDLRDNSYHVLTATGLDASAVLDGFVVEAGNAAGNSEPLGDIGGGLVVRGGGLTVANTRFVGNAAANGGGVANLNGATPSYLNCEFSGNQVSGVGGGAFNAFGSAARFVQTTFTRNTAALGGGGIGNTSSSPLVANSILWANAGGSIYNQGTGEAAVRYSIVEGGYPTGTAVLDFDPLFVDNLASIQFGSPARDFGNPGDLPPDSRDLDGDGDLDEPVPFDLGRSQRARAAVDAGAYESQPGYCEPGGTVFVNANADGADDGSSWQHALTDLQAALSVARACRPAEIWVVAGQYQPSATGDLTTSFDLIEGVDMYGGFDGTEISREQRNVSQNVTTLSGPAYHVVSAIEIEDRSVLDGFTIRDGGVPNRPAGGIRLIESNVTLSNLLVSENVGNRGGGISIDGGTVEMLATTVWRNQSNRGGGIHIGENADVGMENVHVELNERTTYYYPEGGGMLVESGVVRLKGGSFRLNEASTGGAVFVSAAARVGAVGTRFEQNDVGGIGNVSRGGGIYTAGFTECWQCIFVGNSARGVGDYRNPAFGGAVYVESGYFRSVNSTYVENEVYGLPGTWGPYDNASFGSAMYMQGGVADLVHVTVASNRSGWSNGSALVDVFHVKGGTLTVQNSVLWGNIHSDGLPYHSVRTEPGGVANVDHAVIQGSFPGTAILDVDPLFVDQENGDLTLISGSPAANAGLASLLPADLFDLDADGDVDEPLPLDLEGNPRSVAGIPDLGAYESNDPVSGESGAENPIRFDLTAGPNPFVTAAKLRVRLPQAGRLEARVYDALGREVATLIDRDVAGGDLALSLPGGGLASGLYVVRATWEDEVRTLRIVRH